jgi:hypothetical protein
VKLNKLSFGGTKKVFFAFFASSIVASVLNYFFQVIVAYRIGAIEFANFMLSWSYFSLASIVGGYLQYWVSLNPLNPKNEKKFKKFLRFFSIFFLAIFVVTQLQLSLILAVVFEGACLALILGRAIGFGDFTTVNTLNLSTSLIKIILLSFLSERLNPSLKVTSFCLHVIFLLAHLVYILAYSLFLQLGAFIAENCKNIN